jgi:peptidoglycan/xylan/chitin deacetylase (PgdA/CDA1 family)
MSVAQIAELVARGHAVGNHTSSHARLVGLSPDEVKREIVDGAEKIHHWTGKPVDAFAWTFSWDAIDRSAWEVARKHHRYCFTPCPGAVDPRIDSANLIWRREIEARYSSAEYRFQYCGLGDAAWSARRVQLRRLLLADRRDA